MKTLFEIQFQELNSQKKKISPDKYFKIALYVSLIFSLVGKILLSFKVNL